jgi:hypothetical protein
MTGAIVICGFLLCGAAKADAIFSEAEFESFCAAHETVDAGRLGEVMGDFYPVYIEQDGGSSSRIIEPSLSELNTIFRKGIELEWGPLDLFSIEALTAGRPCTIFLDGETLAALDDIFILHSLWMVRIPSDQGPRQLMTYLLAGNGKLVIGYDLERKLTIKVPDYLLHTGKYDYRPYVVMDIVNNAETRGFYNIKVRKSAASKRSPFIGPLNARILSMEAVGDTIHTRFKLGVSGVEKVPRILMEIRGENN